MINFEYTNEHEKNHNSKWPYIPEHPYRILIIGGSGSGKPNALLNLINNQSDIDKINLYAKDAHETMFNQQTWKSRLEALWWSYSFYWILTWYARYWNIEEY